jgi:hypothetical protein
VAAPVIFRNGVALATPDRYFDLPEHRALVAALSTPSFLAAIHTLETAPLTSWLAADVLTGAIWARRYLNTLALLTDKKLIDRAVRALLRVLSGRDVKRGRHRVGPLLPEEARRATAAVAAWRAVVEAVWADRAGRAQALLTHAHTRGVATAHRRALATLLRRRALRKSDVVLTLASWEAGVSVRRMRAAQPLADFVYG